MQGDGKIIKNITELSWEFIITVVGSYFVGMEQGAWHLVLTLTNRAIQSKLRAQVRNFKIFSISEVML